MRELHSSIFSPDLREGEEGEGWEEEDGGMTQQHLQRVPASPVQRGEECQEDGRKVEQDDQLWHSQCFELKIFQVYHFKYLV